MNLYYTNPEDKKIAGNDIIEVGDSVKIESKPILHGVVKRISSDGLYVELINEFTGKTYEKYMCSVHCSTTNKRAILLTYISWQFDYPERITQSFTKVPTIIA